MTSRLKIALALSLLLSLPVHPRAQLVAQEDPAVKPAVVVSLSSIDELMADIGYATRVAGTPEIGGLVTVMASQYIAGIDMKRPLGAYVSFADGVPGGVVFLPVTDFNRVLETLKQQVGEPESVGGGVLKLSVNRPVFLKERGGWVFLSNLPDKLVNLPSNPALALGKLPQQYNVAVQIQVRNIPAELRNTAISEIKANFERRLQEKTSDPDEREVQEAVGRGVLKMVDSVIEDADQITMGWAIDAEAKATYLDVSLTAVKGTDLAKQLDGLSKTRSQFTGFALPGSAATLNFAHNLSPDNINNAKETLGRLQRSALKKIDEDDNLKQPAAKAAVKEAVSLIVKALAATIDAGHLDAGAAMVLEPGSAKFVGGGFVADTASLDTAMRKLVEAAKFDPKFPGVKFDAAKHGNVRYHTMNIPIPAHETQSRKMFGDRVDVSFGIGDQAVYLAFGRDSQEVLNQAIDESASNGTQSVLPLQLILSLGPIFEFASRVDSNPALSQVAALLKKSGKDQISLTTKPLAGGATTRIQIDEAILQAIGQAAKLAQQAGR